MDKAEEFLNAKAVEIGYIDYYNFLSKAENGRRTFLTKKWTNEYANKKVQEALMEVKVVAKFYCHDSIIKDIEEQVEPKYKL